MNEIETFLCLTSIQWRGLWVIATLFVSVIALFLPFIIEYIKNNNRKNIIKSEIDDNYNKLVKSIDTDIVWIDEIDIQIAIVEHISLKLWNEFKYTLIDIDISLYNKYFKINNIIELIIDDRKFIIEEEDSDQKKVIIIRFSEWIKEFITEYKSLFIKE